MLVKLIRLRIKGLRIKRFPKLERFELSTPVVRKVGCIECDSPHETVQLPGIGRCWRSQFNALEVERGASNDEHKGSGYPCSGGADRASVSPAAAIWSAALHCDNLLPGGGKLCR